jgi:hypothetical protein
VPEWLPEWGAIVREAVKGADVILGILIGGTISTLATYLSDRRRFKHENKYRDYGERRQAYAGFLASWNAVQRGSGAVPRNPWTAQYQEELRNRIHETRLQLDKSFYALSLIAPDAVRQAAEDMLDAEGDAEGVVAGVDEWAERFLAAARKDIEKEPSPWWQFWR